MSGNLANDLQTLQELIPALRHKRRVPGAYYPNKDDMMGLTEKQKELRRLVFDFAQDQLRKSANKKSLFRDKKKLWLELGKLGLLGIAVKEEYGGSGGCYLDHVIVQEELSRASISNALEYDSHTCHCIYPIHRYGTEEQKRKYLPKLGSGEHIGSLLMSNSENDNQLIADKQGNYYVINGSKLMNETDANIFVVFATTNRNMQFGMSGFIVERSFGGFIFSENSLVLHNCKVPAANMLGEKNKGAVFLLHCLDQEEIIVSGGPIGLMQTLCDTVFESAHSRNRFAECKDKIAGMYTKLCSSRNYLYTIARACDNGLINRKDTNAVAMYCAKNATELALNAREVLGGNIDAATIRLMADVIVYHIGAGTNEIRRKFVGQMILLEYSH